MTVSATMFVYKEKSDLSARPSMIETRGELSLRQLWKRVGNCLRDRDRRLKSAQGNEPRERVDCQDRQETLLRELYTKSTTMYTMPVKGSIVGEYNKEPR